jgi:hypothetical protein
MLDTSGKTITKDEQGRLKPVVPNLTDDLPVIRDKLKVMRDFAYSNQQKVEGMYDPKGYKNLPWTLKPETDSPSNPADIKYEYRTDPKTGKQQRKRIN